MLIAGGLRLVTDGLRDRLPEVFDAIHRRLHATSAYPENEQLSAAESETIAASLRDVLDYVAGEQAHVPQRVSNEALREVRLAAHNGIALEVLLQASRTAQATLWQFVLEEAHRVLPDPADRVAVLRRASANHFAWNDAIARDVVLAYEQENATLALSGDRRRLATLQALLAGLPADTAALGYSFADSHVAALVSGVGSDALIAASARQLRIRPLAVNAHDGLVWAWWSWPRVAGRARTLLGGLELPAHARIAVGAVGEGLEGFRLSHRQAVEARAVALALDRRRVFYDDVVLEAHALHDLAAVRAFVLEELEPLGSGGDAPENNALVETMRVYFQSGQNAAVTAQKLQVHSRTVAYRLRSVEAKIGADGMNRDEFVVAVRLVGLVAAHDAPR